MSNKYLEDVLDHLASTGIIGERIKAADPELVSILFKFVDIYYDMRDKNTSDYSRIYGDITFKEFKRIFLILLSKDNEE